MDGLSETVNDSSKHISEIPERSDSTTNKQLLLQTLTCTSLIKRYRWGENCFHLNKKLWLCWTRWVSLIRTGWISKCKSRWRRKSLCPTTKLISKLLNEKGSQKFQRKKQLNWFQARSGCLSCRSSTSAKIRGKDYFLENKMIPILASHFSSRKTLVNSRLVSSSWTSNFRNSTYRRWLTIQHKQ